MAIRIPVGGESFDEIRKAGLYYVDKTELIYDLVEKTGNKVTLFTRPRRFGKTLNMSMIESFFDINRDSSAFFDGLNISNHKDFCASWMNQCPVVFISLKDVDGLDFDSACMQLKSILSDYCKAIVGIINESKVDPGDMEIFERLRFKTAELDDIKCSLKTITRMMHVVYGKPVILLIDEYDVPLAKASERNTAENRYYEQMLDVIRGMLSLTLKTNEHLQFAVITGCLRIARESIFTGTNNFATYSVLDNRFSEYFGFTQDEVDSLLESANLSDKSHLFKSWYDGYVFGDTSVYCPWDVVNYASELLDDHDARPKNYWRNTSGNGIIKEFVGKFNVSRKFEILMNGGAIEQTITDEMTYDSLHESEQNLWSILLMTGYLTKADTATEGNAAVLRIPNAEVSEIFQDSVAAHFRESLDTTKQEALMSALWSGDVDKASDIMSDLLWKTISYMDYHEDYYHAFLAGLFVDRGYEVESNKERGLGRPDLQLFDINNRRVIIIEVKKSLSRSKMADDCDDALRQIDEREYAKYLEEGYRTVLCYGIAFYQKSALIKSL